MAKSFRFNSPSTSNDAQGSTEAWKAAGFINFYIPGGETGTTKLGAISLRAGNADEKQLFDWLKANQPFEVEIKDEATGAVTKETMLPLEYILANLTMDFREVREGGGRFALPK